MKTSKELSVDRVEAAHLVISKSKHAMTVIVHDGVVIEAILAGGDVALSVYARDCGAFITAMVLPGAAFDEILEMLISFGGA